MITDPDETGQADNALSKKPAQVAPVIGIDVARYASDAVVIFPSVDGPQQGPSATQSRNLR